MSHSLSVVIVNFNSGHHLSACLGTVVENLEGLELDTRDVLVMDNASSDGSERATKIFAPRVALQVNRENLGFAKAANQGIAATSGDLILLVNPDCRLGRGAVATLANELRMFPECALLGPRILDEDGTVQGSARGDPTMLTGLFGRSTLLTRLFPEAKLARAHVRTGEALASGLSSIDVDWVSGACMLARRDALQDAGGFDERYFLYWEDADLCRRLRARGYGIRYVAGASVVHTIGQSSKASRVLAVRAFHRSAYLYYKTHLVTHRLHPGLWLAYVLLRVRCGWKLLGA